MTLKLVFDCFHLFFSIFTFSFIFLKAQFSPIAELELNTKECLLKNLEKKKKDAKQLLSKSLRTSAIAHLLACGIYVDLFVFVVLPIMTV